MRLARTLLPLVGSRGRVFLAETNFRGSRTGTWNPWGPPRGGSPSRWSGRSGTSRGPAISASRTAATFPAADWALLADGPTVIETIPLRGTTEPEHIPGYFAVMAPRHQ